MLQAHVVLTGVISSAYRPHMTRYFQTTEKLNGNIFSKELVAFFLFCFQATF